MFIDNKKPKLVLLISDKIFDEFVLDYLALKGSTLFDSWTKYDNQKGENDITWMLCLLNTSWDGLENQFIKFREKEEWESLLKISGANH